MTLQPLHLLHYTRHLPSTIGGSASPSQSPPAIRPTQGIAVWHLSKSRTDWLLQTLRPAGTVIMSAENTKRKELTTEERRERRRLRRKSSGRTILSVPLKCTQPDCKWNWKIARIMHSVWRSAPMWAAPMVLLEMAGAILSRRTCPRANGSSTMRSDFIPLKSMRRSIHGRPWKV